jgi:gliding motility-associated-like protein
VPQRTALKFLSWLQLSFLLPCIFLQFLASAQLCSGSLGDPVVNITFSGNSSTSFAPGNNLTYISSPCPDDGFYTVTRATSGCFNNSWHTIPNDHTGDGNFMLVNASYTPSDFFVATVSDLCPETTYEFASWIMNVHRPMGIYPNVTFTIESPDGAILQKFQTGDIPVSGQPTWKQYGFYFTTPRDNAKIVLRMRNNAPGGYGNDLALDDITFRPCGPVIQASIAGNPTDTVDVCEGNTAAYSFNANVSSGYQSPSYQWQLSTDKGDTWKDIAGATSISYNRLPVTTPGNYWYRLAVMDSRYAGLIACRISSNLVIINVHSKPIIKAGPDRIVLTGDENKLDGIAEGEEVKYWWSPTEYMKDPASLKPTISPPSDKIYTLSGISAYGCENEDWVFVKVVTGIYVPSAFTPNNDGLNDTWQIPFLDPAFNATVSVYNRSGRLVYRISGATVSWDGTLSGMAQASGVYVYLITFKNRPLKLKGTLTLIR